MDTRRDLGLGKSSAHGQRGIDKRLGALRRHADLSGGRLLDVGCGDGTYTRILAQQFEQTEAIDIQADRLAMFRGSLDSDRIRVRYMSMDALEYPDAHFDIVTAIEVIEHVTDLDTALREVVRVLRPGGVFALTTPNRWFPIETHGPLVFGRRVRPAAVPFLPWVPPLHRRMADARSFTAHGLTRMLATAGLKVSAVDYIMPPFDRSRLGQRIAPLTDRIERSRLRFFGMALAVIARKA